MTARLSYAITSLRNFQFERPLSFSICLFCLINARNETCQVILYMYILNFDATGDIFHMPNAGSVAADQPAHQQSNMRATRSAYCILLGDVHAVTHFDNIQEVCES